MQNALRNSVSTRKRRRIHPQMRNEHVAFAVTICRGNDIAPGRPHTNTLTSIAEAVQRPTGKAKEQKEMTRQASQRRPASSGHDGKELAESAVLPLPVAASGADEE